MKKIVSIILCIAILFTSISASAQEMPVVAPSKVTVSVSCDTGMGSVTGSGTYNIGDNVVLSATANKGYSFAAWEDESKTQISTQQTYQFVAQKSMSCIAVFKKDVEPPPTALPAENQPPTTQPTEAQASAVPSPAAQGYSTTTITLDYDAQYGSLSVHDEMGKSGAGEYFALSNIYIDIEAKQGYRCKSLKVIGDSYVVTHDGQNLPSYILADSKNMNLSATFEHDPNSAFALTIQDVSNVGIITVSDDYGMSGAGTYYIGAPIHVDVKQTQQDVGIKAISVLSEYESGKTKTDSYKAYPFVFTPKSLENDKLKSVTIGAETEQLYYVTFESSEAAAGTVNNQNGYYSSSTGLEMNTRAAQGCYLSNYTVKNTDGTQYTTGNK
ncbi:MAG: hypothetical protein RR389_08010, partial [Christensenella sp.]